MHDREIAALQDELVNNPNMGYRDRQDYERMIGRLQEERAEYTGQAQGQSMTRSGGTAGRTLLSVNGDDAMHVGLDDDPDDIVNNYEAVEDEPEEEKLTIEELTEINNEIQADIDYNNEMTSPDNFLDDELIANAELSELRGWQITERKQMDTDAALAEIDKQMAEEIAAFDNLKQTSYQESYEFFDENNDQMPAMLGQISTNLNIDLEELYSYTDAQLKQAFAESSWVLDTASQINRKDFIEDITEKYDELKDKAISHIDEEFKPYEQIAELGLSDLWEITGMIEDSEVKELIGNILDIPNNKQLKEPEVNHKEISITNVDERDLHYVENVMIPLIDEKYRASASEEISSLIEDVALSDIPAGYLIPTIGQILGKYSSKTTIENEELFNGAKSIDLGTYSEYEVKYFDNNFNGAVSIFVETDDSGNIKTPPHIYAYKTGNKPGETASSSIDPDFGFYEIGG